MISIVPFRIRMLAWIGAMGALLACGGKVEVEREAVAGSGGSQAGSGGNGGYVAGSSGTAGIAVGGGWAGGSGGQAGDSGLPDSLCPPMPSCNWCNGNPKLDANGCVIGYVCSNGVDPCEKTACYNNWDCEPSQTCKPDGLCVEKSPVVCSESTCAESSDGVCSCSFACSDGFSYGFDCTPKQEGSGACFCILNDQPAPWGCGWMEKPGVSACDIGAECCGFPLAQ